jgi:hypothetical protein
MRGFLRLNVYCSTLNGRRQLAILEEDYQLLCKLVQWEMREALSKYQDYLCRGGSRTAPTNQHLTLRRLRCSHRP